MNTTHLLQAIPERPACTCAGGELCPADQWWQAEGRFQVARLGMLVEKTIPGEIIPAASQQQAASPLTPLFPEAAWTAIETWIRQHGCIPGSYSWEHFPKNARPRVGKLLIYRHFGSLGAFYHACVARGIATEAQRQAVLARRKRRSRM